MARPCKYCDGGAERDKGLAYEAARVEGLSIAAASVRTGMARSSADLHEGHVLARGAREREPHPELKIDPNATPLEQAQAQRKWLTERLEWASRGGLPEKEVAALAGQVSAAVRLVARLSGALDITEIQIVRSPPFARVRAAFDAALKFDGALTARQVRERFEAEIARVLGE